MINMKDCLFFIMIHVLSRHMVVFKSCGEGNNILNIYNVVIDIGVLTPT